MIDMVKEINFVYKGKGHRTCLKTTKIKNGSILILGGRISKVQLALDQYFNWFQKLMWKLCFGVKVENYSEE